jgi:hypothetical protein
MSRAFVKEDDFEPPPPQYHLPPRDDPGFDAAAAGALLEGARVAQMISAEEATGIAWGDPRLIPHIERLRDEAVRTGDDRLEQVATRYLRAATTTRTTP